MTRVRRDVASSGFSPSAPPLDYRTARLTLIRVFHVARGKFSVSQPQLRLHFMAEIVAGLEGRAKRLLCRARRPSGSAPADIIPSEMHAQAVI